VRAASQYAEKARQPAAVNVSGFVNPNILPSQINRVNCPATSITPFAFFVKSTSDAKIDILHWGAVLENHEVMVHLCYWRGLGPCRSWALVRSAVCPDTDYSVDANAEPPASTRCCTPQHARQPDSDSLIRRRRRRHVGLRTVAPGRAPRCSRSNRGEGRQNAMSPDPLRRTGPGAHPGIAGRRPLLRRRSVMDSAIDYGFSKTREEALRGTKGARSRPATSCASSAGLAAE